MITAAYQPIFELATGRVVGVEGLARAAEGTSPAELFAAARRQGRVAELELECRLAAVEGAERAGLPARAGLWINVAPELITEAAHVAQAAVWRRALRRGPTVVELCEAALVADPAAALRGVERLRALGCHIALDDIGADERSLALLAFVRPDVIKLDLRRLAGHPAEQVAATVHAVQAEVERTGALVLAEGIETDEDLVHAQAFGATLGQGHRLASPGPLQAHVAVGGLPAPIQAPPVPQATTPFSWHERAGLQVRRAPKHLVVQVAHQLEAQAAQAGARGALLATFEHRRHFDADAERRYAAIAARAALVAVFGEQMPLEPAPGVRGQALAAGEPLRSSWDVAVVSPHFAAALVSRDLGDTDVPDQQRRFDIATTFRRDLAEDVARMLLHRVRPVGLVR